MIDPQAFVHPEAKLGNNVKVGPWSYIGPGVEIGDDTEILSHVVVKGPTVIGKRNRIFQFASVGEECQDKKYKGEPTRLVIGDDNIIRESVTIHRGTVQDQGLTSIGNNNLFMAYVHVAHDCVIGNNVIMANYSALAGHAHVGDWAILGGQAGVHQFAKVGAHAFVGACALVVQDVPPFVMCAGMRAEPFGINIEGLKRRGYSKDSIRALRNAYKALYRQNLTLEQAKEELAKLAADEPAVGEMLSFIDQSERGIIR
ncbi:acyl-ACP--UDP-N-acetylglucosamine O-acyltransferase [Gallaecimonas kandeliae]|uniref:acyl-ACP--UDP-N-acetylglucosamine O-acyltransferase n=1 Tax=Gallaecimonas kandeliae TaxID=3029055 RepID=UPI00264A494A|nr:acyl-ACP--UDP-N-acetylglucosamine O-acyltransferase [Gallaecimonas kandeliae]WKE64516.1 acyl-ACP--UDP-N-acetylglucosamine O-acyltransferase [Gallaecimonas kandeliae]